MTAAPCSPAPFLQGRYSPEHFAIHINSSGKSGSYPGPADATQIFRRENVLMTDAPPRAEERVGLVHPVTKRYGLVFALLLILALVTPVLAADWPVTTSSNIATTIAGASSDDTITLAPGTYTWHDITITGRSLTFRADTANGHGPWDTIIDAQLVDRIFRVTDGSSLTIDNLTLRNGKAPDGVMVLDYGATGSAGSSGGAISSAGPVIITSSKITGCSAGDGRDGGPGGELPGVMSNYDGGPGGNGGSGGAINTTGTVFITSSTITGCLAGDGGWGGYGISPFGFGGNGGNGGNGGAISAATVTVTSSSITGCSAGTGGNNGRLGDSYGGNGGSGGAILAATVIVTSSSITDCLAGPAGNDYDNYNNGLGGTGNAIYGSGTSMNTWWGRSIGPLPGDIAGGATAPTWLVLGITASPATITTGGTSTISANLTYNSDGFNTATGVTVLNGTPVVFAAGSGSVSSHHAATESGIASTTFTPSGIGISTITATVDQQSVTVPVTVTTPAAGTNVTSIVIDPLAPANVYAGLDGSGIYRSSNAGSTWTNTGTQPANLHIRALAINPTLTNRLWAGTYGGGVYRSVNSGADWNTCTAPANPFVLSLVRNASGSLYAGTDNGIFVSSDDCASWIPINGGLP